MLFEVGKDTSMIKINCFVSIVSEARLRGKIRRITDALEADPVDVATLKHLAISADGLITVDLRSKVWTKLLNVNAHELSRDQSSKKKGLCTNTKVMVFNGRIFILS